ncbi:hypothetical protein [Sphingomonas bacterium]|uniref:hypothetical protein n=1 Tax=Sphingomonas bacterium TaxID=1895847 RepID=UPI0015774455|nr:hypothetical protein [Sphingomonas bacterium]
MAIGRFDKFFADTTIAENKWRGAVGQNYIDSYTIAFSKYKETLDKQKESDKQAGELFVTAACLATGSVLLGSIGSVTMQMIAKRTVITLARKTLTDNLFRLFRTIRKNEGVVFAIGSFTDSLKDKMKEKAEGFVTEFYHVADNILSPEPIVQMNHFENFMRANSTCALQMAELIESEHTLSEAQKDQHYQRLRAAPFYGVPVRRTPPFKATLAEIIELTFYLSAMLETDMLSKTEAGVYGMDGHDSAKSTLTPIGQRPTAPDYPKSTVPAPTYSMAHGAYQTVAVNRAGGDVQKRTNELSTKIAGMPVYSASFFGMMGPPDTEKSKELELADRILQLIAVKMKPLDPFEAIH